MPLLNTAKGSASLKSKKTKILKKDNEIKEKLSGKNYSPIVAKSRKELIKKKKPTSSKAVSKKIVEKPAPPKVQAPSEKSEKKNIDNSLKRTFESINENLNVTKKKKKVSFEIDTLPKKTKVEKILVVKPNLKAEKSKEVNSEKEDAVIIKKTKKKTIKANSDTKPVIVTKKTKKKTIKVNSDTKPVIVTKKAKKQILKTTGTKEMESSSTLPLLTKKKTKSKESPAPEETKKDFSTTKDTIVAEPNKIRKSSTKVNKEANTEQSKSQDIEVEEVKSEELPSLKARKKKVLKSISNIKALMKRPLKAKSLQKKGRTQQQGVCIFKNIPHGFYEKELESYCSQFGKVTGVYHPVSKNGNSRGYAFVRFAHREVAKVVAETMNNYVMFYKRIRCELVPKEREKPGMFNVKKTNEDIARENREKGLKQRMRPLSKLEVAAWQKRKKSRVSALHKKLSELGVDYEFKVNDCAKTSDPNLSKSSNVK